MTVRVPNTATFTLFPALAPELRNQIWEDALPEEKIQPSLSFWEPGCWRLHSAAEPDLELIFHHDLLAMHVEWPLAFVNREARSIALTQIRERGLVARARSEQYPIFVRRFAPIIDAMFIKSGQLLKVLEDFDTRSWQDDLLHQNASVYSRFKSIAMSGRSLAGKEWVEDLHDMLQYAYNSVDELLVVIDAPAALDEMDGASGGAKSQWGFVSAPGDVFRWDQRRRRFVMCGEGEHVGDGVVEALVTPKEVVAKFQRAGGIGQTMFTVRPVYAVEV
jgi:hypothetical protein